MQLNFSNETFTTAQRESEIEDVSWWTFYKKMIYWSAQAYFTFLITYLIFPGTMLSTRLDFLSHSKSRQSWFDIIMITLHAVLDTFGRYLAGIWVIFSKDSVVYLTIARVVHVPLSIAIQLALSPSWLFQADWFRLVNISLFALTQGYNTSLLMIYGPQSVQDHQKEKAGMIMNFHLMGGLCTSSMLSAFVMSHIPQNSHF